MSRLSDSPFELKAPNKSYELKVQNAVVPRVFFSQESRNRGRDPNPAVGPAMIGSTYLGPR